MQAGANKRKRRRRRKGGAQLSQAQQLRQLLLASLLASLHLCIRIALPSSTASSQVSSVALVSVAVASFLVGFLLQVVDNNNNYMQPEALVHALNALLLSFYLPLSLSLCQFKQKNFLKQTKKNKRKQRRLRCDCDGANWHDKPRKTQQQSAQKHLQMLQLSSVQLQQSVIQLIATKIIL